MSDAPTDPLNLPPAEKVKTFPTTPGVYLMKDAQGRVIYVGKAKNLRSRAGVVLHRRPRPRTGASATGSATSPTSTSSPPTARSTPC